MLPMPFIPLRNVHHGRYNFIGSFASLKMRRMIKWESILEYDFIHIPEFEPHVIVIYEQAVEIEYSLKGVSHKYIIDFLIETHSNSYLVECKPSTFVDTEENQAKFKAAQGDCSQTGRKFMVITEGIRSGQRLGNIRILRRHSHFKPIPKVEEGMIHLVYSQSHPLPISRITETISPTNRNAVLPSLLRLIYFQKLLIDLDKAPLSWDTEVAFPDREITPKYMFS